MDFRSQTVLTENYALLRRVSFVILVVDLCGIAVWALGLFELPVVLLPQITSLQLAALIAALVLLGFTLDIGRPRPIADMTHITRWAGVAILAAAAATLFGTSPLIYEGIRITSQIT